MDVIISGNFYASSILPWLLSIHYLLESDQLYSLWSSLCLQRKYTWPRIRCIDKIKQDSVVYSGWKRVLNKGLFIRKEKDVLFRIDLNKHSIIDASRKRLMAIIVLMFTIEFLSFDYLPSSSSSRSIVSTTFKRGFSEWFCLTWVIKSAHDEFLGAIGNQRYCCRLNCKITSTDVSFAWYQSALSLSYVI